MSSKVLITEFSGGKTLSTIAASKPSMDSLMSPKPSKLCEGSITGGASVDRHSERLS